MQYTFAVFFTLALALGVNASVIPWPWHAEVAGHGLSYTAVSGPAPILAHAHAPIWAAHGPAIAVHAPTWAAHLPAAVAVHAAPHIVIDHHAAPHVVIDHHAHAHVPAVVVHEGAPEASYIAKTRGAVHTAPLPGHTQSVASINADPAPGTL